MWLWHHFRDLNLKVYFKNFHQNPLSPPHPYGKDFFIPLKSGGRSRWGGVIGDRYFLKKYFEKSSFFIKILKQNSTLCIFLQKRKYPIFDDTPPQVQALFDLHWFSKTEKKHVFKKYSKLDRVFLVGFWLEIPNFIFWKSGNLLLLGGDIVFSKNKKVSQSNIALTEI